MTDPINVQNSAAQLNLKTFVTAEDEQIGGQKIFKCSPNAPFEVEPASATVSRFTFPVISSVVVSWVHRPAKA
jgi:hypothetical protein